VRARPAALRAPSSERFASPPPVPRALAQEAIRVHGTDLDAAQLFIFQQRAGGGAQAGPSGGASSGPAAKPAAAKPGQAKLSAAEIQAAQDAYDEAVFQRQMAAAQAESTAAAEAEAAQLQAAFEASARAAPLSTFESSAFLAAARETGASEADLEACTEPLAELLLREREAKQWFGASSSPYFARLGVAFVGIAAEARAGWLAAKVVAVSDGPGGMLAMPSGGGGSLPAVFSTCAAGATIISDPEVVVLDDD